MCACESYSCCKKKISEQNKSYLIMNTLFWMKFEDVTGSDSNSTGQ